MNKRGPIITIIGLIMVVTSLSIAMALVPSTMMDSNSLQASSLFEGMFNEVSNEIQIMPGESEYVSYSTLSSNVPLLWGIQINDYQSDDMLSIKISNIFGDEYGAFVQDGPLLFDMLEITQSDTLNLEIKNIGPRSVHVVTMFSEDPENSAMSNPNSPIATMILPLAISGLFLILGIIVVIVGVIVTLVDWKNNQNNKRNY
ncbi:hypothetical protein [Nitrosopumilus sp. S4]